MTYYADWQLEPAFVLAKHGYRVKDMVGVVVAIMIEPKIKVPLLVNPQANILLEPSGSEYLQLCNHQRR